MRRPRPLTIVVGLIVAFLYAPLLVAVLFAFNSEANLSWPPKGLSTRWFQKIFDDASFSAALGTSVKVAFAASIAAVIVGTMSAFVFTRRSGRLERALEGFSLVPVMLPPLLIGVSMLTAIAAFAVPLSLFTVFAGHLVYVIPYVIVVVVARLRNFDIHLEEAARDLGAHPLLVLRRITLPIIAPAVLGAAALSFAFSFDETLITNFTAGQTPTLPLYVVSQMRLSVDPSINAVTTILLVMPWIGLLVGGLILRGSLRGTKEVAR
jgi:spermidine/putrescine transport system permease protein